MHIIIAGGERFIQIGPIDGTEQQTYLEEEKKQTKLWMGLKYIIFFFRFDNKMVGRENVLHISTCNLRCWSSSDIFIYFIVMRFNLCSWQSYIQVDRKAINSYLWGKDFEVHKKQFYYCLLRYQVYNLNIYPQFAIDAISWVF